MNDAGGCRVGDRAQPWFGVWREVGKARLELAQVRDRQVAACGGFGDPLDAQSVTPLGKCSFVLQTHERARGLPVNRFGTTSGYWKIRQGTTPSRQACFVDARDARGVRVRSRALGSTENRQTLIEPTSQAAQVTPPPLAAYVAAAGAIFDAGWRDLDAEKIEFLLHTHMVRVRALGQRTVGRDEPLTRPELVEAARQVIAEVARGLGAEAEAALGTAPDTRGLPKSRRREAAAAARGNTSPTSGRYWKDTYEKPLLHKIGEAFFRLEHLAARQVMAQGGPHVDVMALEWLRRHEYYYGIWTPVYALGADFTRLTRDRWQGYATSVLKPLYRSSLYFYAWYLVEIDRFVRERGGLWILTNPRAEQEVPETLAALEQAAGLREEAESWLRVTLRASADRELVPFLEALGRHTYGQRAFEQWCLLIDSCECSPTARDHGCRVHRIIALCRRYNELIDEDWYAVVGWYRESPARLSGRTYDEIRRMAGLPP